MEHIGERFGTRKNRPPRWPKICAARLADLDRRLAGATPRRVLFVVWTDPLISVGRDTFIADALRRAGGRSVVDTKAEWPHVSLEEIVRLAAGSFWSSPARTPETRSATSTHCARVPAGKILTAMQHGNIVVVSDAINRPAPRMVDAIEQLARALHPEAFRRSARMQLQPVGLVLASIKPHRLKPVPLDPMIEEACACAR